MNGKNDEFNISITGIRFALALQISVFGLIGLNAIGIDILILRQVIVFIYLSFVPGMLILGLLRIRNLSLTRILLLSSGISLSFVMFTSTIANFLLASVGIEKPISEVPLTIFINCVVLLLLGISLYNKNREPLTSFSFEPQSLLSPHILSLIPVLLLLPILSRFGAQNLSINGDNFLLLLLLAIISIVPLCISLDNKLPKKIYPLIIWVMSVSLIYHTSLSCAISIFESNTPAIVEIAGIWDPTFRSGHNSLLAESVLIPIFSILMKVDAVCGVKVISLLFFSFIPVILYEIYNNFFDEKISFLSSCIFMFFFLFYVELPYSTRTGYGFLFLSLLMLLTFDKNIGDAQKKLLLILFAFSIITSHYGVADIFMFILIFASLIAFLGKELGYIKERMRLASFSFSSLYIVLSLSWFMYTARSINFNTLVSYGKDTLTHITEFMQPESSNTMRAVYREWPSLSIEVTKYLLYILIIFTAIGVLSLLYEQLRNKRRESNLGDEYTIFVISFFSILFIVTLPYITGTLRIFALSLIVVVPFSIIGFSMVLKISEVCARIIAKRNFKITSKMLLVSFSLFLLIFLAFSSGFVSNTITKNTGDYSPNFLMDKQKIQNGDDITAKKHLYWDNPEIHNLRATEWLEEYCYLRGEVYVDFKDTMFTWHGKGVSALEYGGRQIYKTTLEAVPMMNFFKKGGDVDKGAYIFLARHNYVERVFIRGEEHFLKAEHLYLFEAKNKIYDNGGSAIYYT